MVTTNLMQLFPGRGDGGGGAGGYFSKQVLAILSVGYIYQMLHHVPARENDGIISNTRFSLFTPLPPMTNAYIYIYVCMYVYIYMCVCVSICVYIYMFFTRARV